MHDEEVRNSTQTIKDVEEDDDVKRGPLRNGLNTNQVPSTTEEVSSTLSKGRIGPSKEDREDLRPSNAGGKKPQIWNP